MLGFEHMGGSSICYMMEHSIIGYFRRVNL